MYKNWEIAYKERATNKFEATKDSITITAPSLSEMKKKIDTHKKQEFKRLPCYIERFNNLQSAEITSIAEETSDGDISSVWLSITSENGNKYREKAWMSSRKLYHTNSEILEEIKDLKKQASELESEINQYITQLTKVTNEDIKNSIKTQGYEQLLKEEGK